MERQPVPHIRSISSTYAEHVLHHVQKGFRREHGHWQLGFGVWQFRIKHPTVYQSRSFLFHFSSFN